MEIEPLIPPAPVHPEHGSDAQVADVASEVPQVESSPSAGAARASEPEAHAAQEGPGVPPAPLRADVAATDIEGKRLLIDVTVVTSRKMGRADADWGDALAARAAIVRLGVPDTPEVAAMQSKVAEARAAAKEADERGVEIELPTMDPDDVTRIGASAAVAEREHLLLQLQASTLEPTVAELLGGDEKSVAAFRIAVGLDDADRSGVPEELRHAITKAWAKPTAALHSLRTQLLGEAVGGDVRRATRLKLRKGCTPCVFTTGGATGDVEPAFPPASFVGPGKPHMRKLISVALLKRRAMLAWRHVRLQWGGGAGQG